jgi:menaquinone-dependent protoporphyrinogen oxidase
VQTTETTQAGSRSTAAHAPRLLVVVASRHGSTAEIGAALAHDIGASDAATAAGLTAVAVPADQRPDPGAFDAVVLGSAVYAGRWLDLAREYAATHAAALRERPVWLFSSGPIGNPVLAEDEPHDAAPLAALTAARAHRIFPGRLDPSLLSFGERAMATAMRAPIGDFRDWAEIRAWAAEIAAEVAADRSSPAAR